MFNYTTFFKKIKGVVVFFMFLLYNMRELRRNSMYKIKILKHKKKQKEVIPPKFKNKNEEFCWYRKQQMKEQLFKKEYIAIVCGHLPARHGSIKTQIMRDPKNRKKFIATEDTTKGKFSHTVYKCIQVYGQYSLVRLRLKTGRTHQIRVHLKYLGCPILGDPIYGKKDSLFDSATLMLHAKKLTIRLPSSDTFMEFESQTPIRFKKVMQKLHTNFSKTFLSVGK